MRDRHVCGGRSHRGECAADAGNDVRSEALRGEGLDEHEDSDQDGAERESDGGGDEVPGGGDLSGAALSSGGRREGRMRRRTEMWRFR